MMQIIEYLASPAGEKVLREISDKHDEYRVKLKIPEPGGTFKVKMSAGSIRESVRHVVGQDRFRPRTWASIARSTFRLGVDSRSG